MDSIKKKTIRYKDNFLLLFIYLSVLFSISLVTFIIIYVFYKGLPHFSFKNLIEAQSAIFNPNGLLGNIINTLYIIIGTLILALPIGISGGIYLNEYAKNKTFASMMTFACEVLAGIPSIIFGLFGMIFFGQILGLKYSILTGCLTLTLLVLPIIVRNTQTALQSVPQSYREAALGLGSQKWTMIYKIILPSSIPGILTGVILAIGRIIAESAALLFTAGSGYFLPKGLFDHLFSSGGTLTIQLYISMSNANYAQAFVIGMILILIILIMNMLAKYISKRFNIKDEH